MTADASGSTAGSSPISSYSFDSATAPPPGRSPVRPLTHTYQSAGTYTVTVTVTDGNNMTSTASQNVTATAASSNAKYVNQIAANTSTSSHTSGSVTVWRTGGVTVGDLMVVTAGDALRDRAEKKADFNAVPYSCGRHNHAARAQCRSAISRRGVSGAESGIPRSA